MHVFCLPWRVTGFFLFNILLYTNIASGQLTVNPSSISFGSVPVGSSAMQSLVLGNSGGSILTVSQATMTGSGISLSGPALPLTLAAGQSASFSATFAPQSSGTINGSLSLTWIPLPKNNGKRKGWSSKATTVPVSGTGTIPSTASTPPGQLVASPSSLGFGSVQVGNSQPLQETVTNSGGSSVTITQAPVTGAGFSMTGINLPVTLTPGQSATFNVTFAPQSGGSASGNVSIASNASNATLTIPFSGTGVTPGSLTASPASLSFGSAQVGNTKTLSEAVTNSGGSSVTLSQATVAGIGFGIKGLSLPLTLAAGQSVTFTATFAPQSAGSASGSISVSSNALNSTMTISLAGTGIAQGQLAVTPTSLDFGSVTVGTSKSQTSTLTASGSSVSVSSATVTNAEFSLSGITFPLTIAAGQSVPFTLKFTPQMSGSTSAIGSFTSNASNSATETLTGTGAAPPQHRVDLSWNGTSTVVGYNIYRGSQSGGPYTKINSTLEASTTYTDSSVQAGQTYYYVTTSSDSGGAQSAYSNEIQVVIPSP